MIARKWDSRSTVVIDICYALVNCKLIYGAVVDRVHRLDLAELFIRNPGKVYSRENLLDIIWGYDYQGDIRTVDVHINRLRERFRESSDFEIITIRGLGYKINSTAK